MNYGGDAADQVVKYSMDGMERGLRLSGTLAKHMAVFFAAVLKDQRKNRGKTHMVRMLRENRPLKFFTVPSASLHEFAREGKKHGLLYVVIRDRKNPEKCEVMVFADDAAKVNRVMDRMQLDFLKSQSGNVVLETTASQEAAAAYQTGQEPVKPGMEENVQTAAMQTESVQEETIQTEPVQMPEGEIRFEISDFEEDFNIDFMQGDTGTSGGNFTKAQEAGNGIPSGHSLRSSGIFSGQENEGLPKPSVRAELSQIRQEKQQESEKKRQQRGRKKGRGQLAGQNRKKKGKSKEKGR